MLEQLQAQVDFRVADFQRWSQGDHVFVVAAHVEDQAEFLTVNHHVALHAFLNHVVQGRLVRSEAVRAADFAAQGQAQAVDVCPMVAELIGVQLEENQLNVADVKRFWLHQANLSMNHLIVKKLLGREASVEEAPVILDTYANTSSAGSVIAFHTYQDDLPKGSVAVLSSFGAGYSIGSVILRKR